MTIYPTEWAYGKPIGRVIPREQCYTVEIISSKKKNFYKSYYISNFESKDECYEHAKNIHIKKSHDLGLTTNEIRFINENIIEIQITKNKTFITDAEHFDIVEKYKLHTVTKKEGKINRYYAYVGKNDGGRYPFTDLIVNYKQVDYINGNTLDLRKINLKEFGLGYVTKTNDDNDNDNDNLMDDMAKYYFMDINDLPKNKWILGTVEGTTFERSENKNKIVTMVFTDKDGKKRSKTFNKDNYGSIEQARIAAKNYLINISHKLDNIKNKIRILDDTIEIFLEENIIMKTNLCFLPLFIPNKETYKAPVMVIKTFSSENALIYAAIYIRATGKVKTFHSFIMGNNMVDHINNDPLDNCLENLRFTTYSHNNTNKIAQNDTGVNGVTYGNDRSGKFYRARIKDNGKEYCKYFYIKKYKSKEEALKLASNFRKNILEINTNLDSWHNYPFKLTEVAILRNLAQRIKDFVKNTEEKMVYDMDKYLIGIDETVLSLSQKKVIFIHYISINLTMIEQLNYKVVLINKIINNILMNIIENF
ncbi:MAG: HNH endonuclease [Satyrvirus sp.]|uniref:HNH endonuclease n=1 Tax=Satyrvirus sp. TaxID=2487771 RepID=A0A3G5ACV7_9VIRU|nr:MAG: HNH endonuclease [Satyrvirus sp.]